MEFPKNWLREQYINENKVMELLNLTVMYQNIFQFKNKYHKQIKSTVMRNSLSLILTEIFTSKFNTKLNNTYVKLSKIRFRYVDGIFTVMDKNLNAEVFKQNLSSYYSSIVLMIEHEVERKLPYLDLSIKNAGEGQF